MGNLTATLKVRLSDEQLAELERRAAEAERPTSAIARRAIADYLARWRKTGAEPRHG